MQQYLPERELQKFLICNTRLRCVAYFFVLRKFVNLVVIAIAFFHGESREQQMQIKSEGFNNEISSRVFTEYDHRKNSRRCLIRGEM